MKMPATSRPSTIMSLADVDEVALSAIAEACRIPKNRIQDIYSCTPLQSSMIAKSRNEMFHFVLSPARPVDPDPFCDALRQVVAHNEILRTRIVNCAGLGDVNVVTDEEHVTNRNTGFDNIEVYLREDDDAPHHNFDTGGLLFRSAYVGHHAVLTLHHSVMDYWSIDKLIQLDLSVVYAGEPPIKRPPFKEFARYCLEIEEDAARAFWMPRFKAAPAIFPEPRSSQSAKPCVSEKTVRHMSLQRMTGPGALASSHMPLFIEAAWALTMAIYTNSESLAYGLVLSGRSMTLNGIENTLGPTVTEVPVQVNLRRQTMTVDNLIKDRAAALRQLQQHGIEVQYGLVNISALSEPARAAAGFQTLINIRPAVFSGKEPGDTANGNHVKLRMVWMQGYYPLQLIFSIMEDGITVWARTDSAVISDGHLDRILNQFEHTLRLLTEVPLQTRLADLPLLDAHARVDISDWNRTLPAVAEMSLIDTFDTWAQSESPAVEAADGSATHVALHSMSNQIADQLRRRAVIPGKPVGFLFEKSLSAIVALLGLLKAGGICVPIEKYDEVLLSSVGAELLVTSSASYAHVPSLRPNVFVVGPDFVLRAVVEKDSEPLPDGHTATTQTEAMKSTAQDLAYIFFTSEDSGVRQTPVMLSHGHLVSALTWHVDRFDWQPDCRIVQSSSFVSSQSLLEILGSLIAGGCICMPCVDEVNLPAFITSARANGAVLPPSVIRTMSPSDVPGLRFLASVGGEAFPDDRLGDTWAGEVRLFRGWALGEASMLMTVGEVVPNPRYADSMGKPVGCLAWVTNPDNTNDLAPLGGVGEVVIEGGSGVLGHANVSPPAWAPLRNNSATRGPYFRTGMLAKNNPDGSVSPVGRMSNRLKLGGQMIQLEQIERVLVRCSQLRDAVVVARIAAGRTQLVAVVCLADPRLPSCKVLGELPEQDARAACQAVSAWALSGLSPALVPTVIHVVEELPRSLPHRVDRLAVREWLRQPHN
ncbi:hypothetical protein HBH92_224170 [Parastagonospora nodorum]|nr:hypothetical protein HBH92_224170 [Parastagonospora nodorum]KAH4430853.1 hypothetical protein HBH91_234470 [Parastagonospora nodorum]KAH4439295.1 hypothetical protein HBH93_089400 [Parastagonospora nodorum]KAH4486360.1 hypothetical protein HBH89_209120 [Parastagonospora nodorum]KAH4546087.1 hypothetical protein HBH85_081610 [Parastagonospora nodorum]